MAIKVVLTGATGFIATYVFKQLLEKGYFVVATVRNPDKAAWLANLVSDYKDNYVFETVKDISEKDAFDELFKKHPDVKYVVHTASPFYVTSENPVEDILTPAINGTTGILKSIKSFAPDVEKVVITSSFAAIVDSTTAAYVSPEKHYSEKVWNPITYEQSTANGAAAYYGSKKLAEEAFWDFIEKETKAGTIKFKGTAIAPPYVFGPPLQKVDSFAQLNTSNQILYSLLGSKKGDATEGHWTIGTDILDVVNAHVRALETDKSAGQRWFVHGGYFSDDMALDIIEKEIPELKGKVAEHKPYDIKEVNATHAEVNNTQTLEQSGLKFMPVEESIAITVKALYELKKKWENIA